MTASSNKKNKYDLFWAVSNYGLSIFALILGALMVHTIDNVFKKNPDFLFFRIVVFALPIIAIVSLISYFKISGNKNRAHWWFNLAMGYVIFLIVWQILQNNKVVQAVVPYDFIANNNLMGMALAIYNVLMLLPVIFFLIMGARSLFLGKQTDNDRCSSPRAVIILAAIVLLIFGLKRALLMALIYGDISVPKLPNSAVYCDFQQVYTSDDGGKYLDAIFYNTEYSYDSGPLTFYYDDQTKFLNKNGKTIQPADIIANSRVKIVYKFNDAEDSAVSEVIAY